MTIDEFVEMWLRDSGLEALPATREARPCDCGNDLCLGWQMAYVDE